MKKGKVYRITHISRTIITANHVTQIRLFLNLVEEIEHSQNVQQ